MSHPSTFCNRRDNLAINLGLSHNCCSNETQLTPPLLVCLPCLTPHPTLTKTVGLGLPGDSSLTGPLSRFLPDPAVPGLALSASKGLRAFSCWERMLISTCFIMANSCGIKRGRRVRPHILCLFMDRNYLPRALLSQGAYFTLGEKKKHGTSSEKFFFLKKRTRYTVVFFNEFLHV